MTELIDQSHRDPKSRYLFPQPSLVDPHERIRLLGQLPGTVWLTGYSGSGKSTIAYGLEQRLTNTHQAVAVLDGDTIRMGLSSDLGFSLADRSENIRRVAEVAKLMNTAGLIVIVALISPLAADREHAKQIIGPDYYIEVFVDTPLEICRKRDPKGLYKQAQAGLIADFTGVSSPYEAPRHPDVRLCTSIYEQNLAIAALFHEVKTRLLDPVQTISEP